MEGYIFTSGGGRYPASALVLEELMANGRNVVKVTGVETAGWVGDKNVISYGTLEKLGFLKKEYVPGLDEDSKETIVWTVLKDFTFTDSWGDTYTKDQIIEWPG